MDNNKETLAQFHLKVPDHNTIWRAMKFVPEDYLRRLNHSARKRNIVIVRSQGSKAWKNMLLEYAEKPDDWNKIYHFRSSAETAFSAIKRKFGYQLSSIRRDFQQKELMTKVIAYNLNIVARITI